MFAFVVNKVSRPSPLNSGTLAVRGWSEVAREVCARQMATHCAQMSGIGSENVELNVGFFELADTPLLFNTRS